MATAAVQVGRGSAGRKMTAGRVWLGWAASAALAVAVAGCDTARLFVDYGLPESPDVAAAPWPRLVDVPDAPPVGVYTASVPDPARGARTQVELAAATAAAGARADRLSGPITGQGGDQSLTAAAQRARARAERLSASSAAGQPTDAALIATARAARARAAELAGPVIEEDERARLERARQSR